MEHMTMRVYDLTWAFEIDWGPQISKPGSTFKSLGFYGSIQNLDTSEKDDFDPKNMIMLTQTSANAPNITSGKTTTAGSGDSPTQTAANTNTASSPQTTSTSQATGDLWSDIPVYPNARSAESEGFELPAQSDDSHSQIEWHFFASTDDFSLVVDFYKKQMPAKGWTRMMWADLGEMSYGSFQKNDETRLSLVYVIKEEGGASINIQSAAK